jgi:hypothetical protein
MITGIGTPSSQSEIPRPMMFSFGNNDVFALNHLKRRFVPHHPLRNLQQVSSHDCGSRDLIFSSLRTLAAELPTFSIASRKCF